MLNNKSQGNTHPQTDRLTIQVAENERLEENALGNRVGHNNSSSRIAAPGKIHSDLSLKEHENKKNSPNYTKQILNPSQDDQLYEEDNIVEEADGRDIKDRALD